MVCKICGCEMINNGSWFACPTCGAVEFGVEEKPIKKETRSEEMTRELDLLEKDLDEFLKTFADSVDNKKEEVLKPEVHTAPVVEEKAEEPVIETAPVIEDKTEEPAIEIAPTVEEKVNCPEPEATPATEEEIEKDIISAFEGNAQDQENDIVSPINDKNEAPESDITSVFDENDEPEAEEGVFFTVGYASSSVKSDAFTGENTEFEAFDDDASTPADDEAALSDEKKRSKKDKKKKGEEKKKNPVKDIVEFLIPIVAAVIIAFFLKTFIIANAVVPTGSMMETINIKDRIIASRLAYRTEGPSRYDIILFYYPENEKEIFVKRVLGLPGETVTVIDGVVYVTTKQGKTIQTDQSFINPTETPTGNYGPYYIPEKGEKITVENGYCYAENGMTLGNADFLDKYCVKDSRGNYVIEDELYFMIGDNRNNSSDSRMWKYPYVADDKIIGKVIFKYYPNFEKLG